MIKNIQLNNYRCFENTKINFKDIAVVVGKNNAGKSSLIEALRLIALSVSKGKRTTYKDLPQEFKLPKRDKGFRLESEKLKIDLRSIVYRYGNLVAMITVKFTNDAKVCIFANEDHAYAVLYDKSGNCVKSKSKAKEIFPFNVSILPQIGLIKEVERKLTEETVEKDKESYLSSRHFRNEIFNYRQMFWKDFVQLAETTWTGLRIKEINYDREMDLLSLYIIDFDFAAEIGLMGSGLQMWLQIIWFLARTKDNETIILDEPDVYMHPDLQRKLIRILQDKYPQVIIATHSIEIISEVEPSNIIRIDKKSRKMNYTTDLSAVQKVVDEIGTVSNLSLIRLGDVRKCVFVEGQDLKLLTKIAKIVLKEKNLSLEELPHVSLNGFNNLREAFGTSQLFYDETKGIIQCICVLDSDYFPKDLLEEKKAEAFYNHLDLHIWSRKEIENYLLEPEVLFRLSKQKEPHDIFMRNLETFVDTFKNDVLDQYAEHIFKYRKIDISTANKEARNYIEDEWINLQNKLSMVGGKIFLKKLFSWFKTKYGENLTKTKIISEFNTDDFDEEIVEVIHNIYAKNDK